MKYREKKTDCCREGCNNPRRTGQRTCKSCHADDSKRYRAERVYVKRTELPQMKATA